MRQRKSTGKGEGRRARSWSLLFRMGCPRASVDIGTLFTSSCFAGREGPREGFSCPGWVQACSEPSRN